MAHNPDSDQHKRKRDISDDNGSQAPHADRIPQPPPPQSGMSHTHQSTRAPTPKPKLTHIHLHTPAPLWSMGNSHMEHDNVGVSCCLVSYVTLVFSPILVSLLCLFARHKYHKSQITFM